MAELMANLDQSTTRPPAARGLGNHPPRASALRGRVGPGQDPITVAEPVPGGGTLDILVLLDRKTRGQETLEVLVDRVGPQLGRVVVCVPMETGANWARVAVSIEELKALAAGTPFGARVAFGRRDETVALEACEAGFRLVVDLSEDDEVRRTLKMCGIAYVVGPKGVARFAEEASRRPRLLTRPRDVDSFDPIRLRFC